MIWRGILLALTPLLLSCAPIFGVTVLEGGLRIRVHPSGLLSAAVARAVPGAVIEVEPGTYRQSVSIDVPGVTLLGLVRGDRRPILDGRHRRNEAVIASAGPFRMSGFRIRRYRSNGVIVHSAPRVVLSDLEIEDTGRYGVFPFRSSDVQVSGCRIRGASDAGIYVGQSSRVRVAGNEVSASVVGIEIENSNDVEVTDNLVRGNTVGIVLLAAPGKLQKEARRARVHGNRVLANNLGNFGDPVTIVGRLAPGVGILLLAADETRVWENEISDHATAALRIARLAREEAEKDPHLNPLPDANRLGTNRLERNGAAVDWDGTGRGNCTEVAGSVLPPCER